MTAVAPSPLPFTANLAHDSPRSSHPGIKNSPFRQHHHHHGSVAASSPASMRNGINGKPVFAGLSASSNASLATYGDGIKALLADPIEFEPYAKKVVTDETKYKPINSVQENGEMESLAQESAVAGPSRQPFSYSAGGDKTVPLPSAHVANPSTTDLWPRPVKTSWPNDAVYDRHTKGLHNLGNTCFANSILQVMMYTPPVLYYLGGDGHNYSSCVLSAKGFCFTCELQKARRNLWTSNGSSWAPKDIMKSIKKICPTMRQFRQEDAHEFFRYGIDLLHNEALKVAKATKESHAVKETSWIHKVWGGRLRSRITCHECGNNSDTFDAFLDLSLDLDRNTESVKDALARFVQKDSLSGKNKYKCEKCKKLVNATKQMQIVKAPEVLSLHLKRFTPTGRKITSTIRYTANLSLDPYMDKESKSPFYELYAVTVHQGSGPHLGHYYSFVKNKNGKWFEANDESVNASQAKIYASAYILHYIRKPGSALDAIKAGKQTGLNTPRKSTSDDVRQERSDLPVSTPVGGSSSPSKRGEKRKQRNEDPTTEDEQPVQRRERQQDSATPRADASVTADDDSSRDGEQHIRKKNRAQGKPFAPVSPQQFGFGTSSVSQALKSTQGSDRMFEARPPVHGHKKGGKNRAGKVNSSPYATGGMDGKHKKTRMMGRNFKR